MATLENTTPANFRAHLEQMDEPELLAQQLTQRGAIHVLTFLLTNGCSEALAIELVASLRMNMALIVEIAQAKGLKPLFSDVPPNFN
jgi:hypothetical protein